MQARPTMRVAPRAHAEVVAVTGRGWPLSPAALAEIACDWIDENLPEWSVLAGSACAVFCFGCVILRVLP